MGLQFGTPPRDVSRQVAFCSFMVSCMVILLFVSAAAGESVSSSLTSRKQIEPEEHREKVQLKDWVGHYGEGTWKAVSSEVIRLWSSEDYNWPELKLGTRTISAMFLAALAASVSFAAGLGGGIFFVPLLKLLLQFDSKTSIAMSTFMMFGGSTAGVALNLMRNHPTEFNKPLVDFDIVLLLQPNLLLGSSIGVILNNMLSSWLIAVLLEVTLIYMVYNTTKNGLKRWNNETQLAHAKKNPKKKTLRRSNTESEKALTEHLLGFYRSVSSRYHVQTILGLVFIWLIFFFLHILRGAHEREGLLHVPECGLIYWLLTASQIPVAFGVTAWNIWQLQRANAETPEEASTSDSQDRGFTLGPKESTFFSGMALLGGIMAGMLGIGGALIITPLLLSAGVLPQVTAATSLFMMFFTSSMSAVQYWLMGRIPLRYALVGSLICAVSSAVGMVGLQKLVNRYGRPSLMVFVVAGVIAFSAVLMGVYGPLDIWAQYKSGADMGFSRPC